MPWCRSLDEDSRLTIVPILKRELIVASRRAGLHSGRSTFVGLLLAIVMGIFGAWYYSEAGHFSHYTLAKIATAVVRFDLRSSGDHGFPGLVGGRIEHRRREGPAHA